MASLGYTYLLLYPCTLWPLGVVHVNRILHVQGCVITNLFLVEDMLWQLRMRTNDHEHADGIDIES